MTTCDSLIMNIMSEPYAGKPHVRFDEEGGNPTLTLRYVDGMGLYNGYFAPGGVDPWGFSISTNVNIHTPSTNFGRNNSLRDHPSGDDGAGITILGGSGHSLDNELNELEDFVTYHCDEDAKLWVFGDLEIRIMISSVTTPWAGPGIRGGRTKKL